MQYRYWDKFEDGGIKRLVNEGNFFRNAYFRHLQTSTGPGHVAQLTGATPGVPEMLTGMNRRLVYVSDIASTVSV